MDRFTIIISVGIIFYIFTCLAFVDIARKRFDSVKTKAIWGIIAFIPFIGCVVYFLLGSKKGKAQAIENE